MTSAMVYRAVEKQTPGELVWKDIEDVLRVLVSRGVFIVGSRRFRVR